MTRNYRKFVPEILSTSKTSSSPNFHDTKKCVIWISNIDIILFENDKYIYFYDAGIGGAFFERQQKQSVLTSMIKVYDN